MSLSGNSGSTRSFAGETSAGPTRKYDELPLI